MKSCHGLYRVPICTLPKTFADYSRRAYRGDDLSVGQLALVEGDVAAGEGGEGAEHQGAHQQKHSNLRVKKIGLKDVAALTTKCDVMSP